MHCNNCGGTNAPNTAYCKFCDTQMVISTDSKDNTQQGKTHVTTTTTTTTTTNYGYPSSPQETPTYNQGSYQGNMGAAPIYASQQPLALYRDKSKTITLILCVVLGLIGGHYFYVRRYGMGLLYFFTRGLFGIGWLYDIYRIATGRFVHPNGTPYYPD